MPNPANLAAIAAAKGSDATVTEEAVTTTKTIVRTTLKDGTVIGIDFFTPNYLSMEDRMAGEGGGSSSLEGQERLEFWRKHYVESKGNLIPMFVLLNGILRRCCCRHELNDREPEDTTVAIRTKLGKDGFVGFRRGAMLH